MEPSMQSNSLPPNAGAEADELRKIATDIETYLGKWVVRSRRVIEHGRGSTTSDVAMSTQMQKFEEKQRKWEARRQREMDDIADKAEELTVAWLKLESEQRQFLQMKESWQHRTNQAGNLVATDPSQSTAPTSHDEPNPHVVIPDAYPAPVAASPRVPQYAPQVAPRSPANAAYGSDRPACGNERDVAIRQFEQLRREVGAKQGP